MKTAIKRVAISLGILLLMLPLSALFAETKEAEEVQIAVRGVYAGAETKAVLIEGRTYVPLRFVAENLGYTVDWKEQSKEITLRQGEKNLQFRVGSDIAVRDGKERKLEREIFILDDKAYLPLRFVGESFGEKVNYHEATRTAVIGDLPAMIVTEFENGSARKMGLISIDGKTVLKPNYRSIESLGEGRFAVEDEARGKVALVDYRGKHLTEFLYDEIERFQDGYAVVAINPSDSSKKREGLIDKNGKEVLPLNYLIESFREGYFAVRDLEKDCGAYLHPAGNRKDIEGTYFVSPFSEGLADFAVRNDELQAYQFGLIDKNFNRILEPKYDLIQAFSEGFASFRVGRENAKWGYLNREGKVVIEPKFDYAGSFQDGRAIVRENGLDGMIDVSGAYVVRPGYVAIDRLAKNFYAFNVGGEVPGRVVGGKWGFMDANGKIIVEAKYDNMAWDDGYEYGYVPVSIVKEDGFGYWGMMDAEGREVIPVKYNSIRGFREGLAIVSEGRTSEFNPRYGAIDKNGNYVLKTNFEFLESFRHGIAVYVEPKEVSSEEIVWKYGLMNKKGKKITEAIYDEIRGF